MVDQSRWFQRVLPQGVITEEMKELDLYELREYCGQLYRRMDRMIKVLDRAEKEGEHTTESLIRAFGRQASTEFDRRNIGYEAIPESEDDE